MDQSPIEGSRAAPSARAEQLRSRATTFAIAASAVLLGSVLATFVVPQLLAWWGRVFLSRYRSPLSQAVAESGLGEWGAAQFSMLAIRIPEFATALAVGAGIGLLLRARSRLVAAACALGMIAANAPFFAFAGALEDLRVVATLIRWDLAVALALLIGESLGRRLRRRDAPPPPATDVATSFAQRRAT